MAPQPSRTFAVSNRYKKTVIETERWSNGITVVAVETVWRGGKWHVTPEGEEPVPVDGQDGIDFDDYSNYELDSTWDGCSCDLLFISVPSEEEQARIEAGFADDGDCWLSDNGFESLGCRACIEGEIDVVEEKQDSGGAVPDADPVEAQ